MTYTDPSLVREKAKFHCNCDLAEGIGESIPTKQVFPVHHTAFLALIFTSDVFSLCLRKCTSTVIHTYIRMESDMI